MAKNWQQPLPPIYQQLSEAELRVRVQLAKEKLGSKLVILGHHYQQDAVIEFADFTGDSFELSRKAAEQKEAQYVIFCGVHFMAESADILTDETVQVILPDLGAGCSMADMANLDQTLECWAQLEENCPDQTIVPVTYMNSSAAIKAFVGEHGGAVCTSSNCRNVLEWALKGGAKAEHPDSRILPSPGTPGEGQGGGFRDRAVTLEQSYAPSSSNPHLNPPPEYQGRKKETPTNPEHVAGKKVKVLFFPDQHLGRNTAYAMGYPLDKMVVWDPRENFGGNDATRLRNADFVLWKGHCSVHQLFRPEHVDQVRERFPEMKVMVHPECRWEVVQKADISGSTAYIVKQIQAAPPGSQWAVGTEVHLISRLAREHPEQKIIVLSECQCLCTTMYRIDLPHLCWVMENLLEGTVVNQIQVDAHTRRWAIVALERMLAIKGNGNPIGKQQPVGTTVD